MVRSNVLQEPEEQYLVRQEEVFFHNTKTSSDGQQLSLFLLLSGEIGEENHLTVLDVVLPGVTLHGVLVSSLLSVCGAKIFLMGTRSRYSASTISAVFPNTSGLTSMTSRVLDR